MPNIYLLFVTGDIRLNNVFESQRLRRYARIIGITCYVEMVSYCFNIEYVDCVWSLSALKDLLGGFNWC